MDCHRIAFCPGPGRYGSLDVYTIEHIHIHDVFYFLAAAK